VAFLFELLAQLLFGWFWWLIPDEVDRRRDLKRYLEGEVRCEIRAVDRRVLNISTEGSVGVATFEPGMLRFSPSVGIVGDRVVPVQSIRPGPTPNALADDVRGMNFTITTTGGALLVRFPTVVAEKVAAVLAGEAPEPDEPRA
jgi:hypothetical protein